MKVRFTLIAVAAAALTMVSCSKEDPTAVNVTTQATITGLVRGNIDLSNDFRIELVEVAPGEFENDTIEEITMEALEGVRIFATFNTQGLTTVADPNHVYGNRVVEAETDAEGRYTLMVPAGANPISVALTGNELEVNRIEEDGSTERKTFTTSSANVSVTQNATRIRDFDYFAN